MPYKCVNCSKLYEDGSNEVLTGCSSCHRKFFFYIKKEKMKEIEETSQINIDELSQNEKKKIEQDVREIVGIEDQDEPVFLDFESIKVVRQGKYLLDIAKLFSKQPKVYQLEDGKYIVDLSKTKEEKGI